MLPTMLIPQKKTKEKLWPSPLLDLGSVKTNNNIRNNECAFGLFSGAGTYQCENMLPRHSLTRYSLTPTPQIKKQLMAAIQENSMFKCITHRFRAVH